MDSSTQEVAAMASSFELLEAVVEKLAPEDSQAVLRFAEFLLQRQRSSVDARAARRKVSTWLVREVGNLLMGGEPTYFATERPVWRVPVVAPYAPPGPATWVDVDAQTGELLIVAGSAQKVLSSVEASCHSASN
jgi:hypothetical protein